jgi:hypothetical protein
MIELCLEILLNIVDEGNDEYKLILIDLKLEDLVRRRQLSDSKSIQLSKSLK